jgi:hypothetical protein
LLDLDHHRPFAGGVVLVASPLRCALWEMTID